MMLHTFFHMWKDCLCIEGTPRRVKPLAGGRGICFGNIWITIPEEEKASVIITVVFDEAVANLSSNMTRRRKFVLLGSDGFRVEVLLAILDVPALVKMGWLDGSWHQRRVLRIQAIAQFGKPEGKPTSLDPHFEA